jgi:hypothetical protein
VHEGALELACITKFGQGLLYLKVALEERPKFKIAQVLKSICLNCFLGTGTKRILLGHRVPHNKAHTGRCLVRIRVSGVALPLRTVLWTASGCSDHRVRTC